MPSTGCCSRAGAVATDPATAPRGCGSVVVPAGADENDDRSGRDEDHVVVAEEKADEEFNDGGCITVSHHKRRWAGVAYARGAGAGRARGAAAGRARGSGMG